MERTHDLDALLDRLYVRQSDLIEEVKPLCKAFAEVYFTSRYPGFDFEDADWPSIRSEIEAVADLLAVVKLRLSA